ncbi:hypothetical protein VitviT2T_010414 [Vitis vinifera]|uniref:Retrotransposon gag domain-containing protein n=1 Tax=Vitis vinifera TaxID=29760 RepID=A0ABY9C7N5_VITVI|nr:hypothetical protein VitviT2T_010414 [Vitis vinifera]
MSSYLEKLETRMAITTDMWTSNQKKGYMAITVHYIDESWLLHHDIVRIRPLFLVLIYLCGSEQRRSTFKIRIFTLSLGIVSWIRVEGRLVRVSDTPDMDQQVVTVDQFTAAMASIQEALASLRQEIGVAQAVVADDTHARMDRIEQRVRQLRVSDGAAVWDDLEGMPVASLPTKFRMPNIERYTGIGCLLIHLRLYSTMMRAHGLDEPQMITLFPLSLSGAAQYWFASLESSKRRTWDDLTQEFLRQFSFNTIVDVSRRELEALRQMTEESILLSFPAGAGR